jgi:MFS family permease
VSTATYRILLRTPGAATFFFPAGLGRIGIAMTSLGIVWLIHAQSGSYATAGLVTGGFAVAEGLGGPQIARLMDRRGQTTVLPPLLLAHAVAVVTLVVLTSRNSPVALLLVGGAAVGATIPQLGALSAARWSALLRLGRGAELPTAFSLESLSNGAAYLIGPVVVSAIGASGHTAVASLTAAGLVVVGGLILAGQRETAPTPTPVRRGDHAHGRSLVSPIFLLLIGINLAIGVYFGAMQVSVTAFTVERGHAEAAAPLFAISSAFGLLGGWVYGVRHWKPTPSVQLAAVSSGLAVVCLSLILTADSEWRLGLGIAIAGLAVPAILVLCSVMTESGVPRGVLTQAFTWQNSASAAGSAGAAAATGSAIDAAGAHGGFVIVAAAASTMAVVALLGLRATRSPR